MSYLKTKSSTFFLSAVLMTIALAAPGNCTKCCLSEIIPIDSLTAVLSDSGFTDVMVTSKTCDKVGFTATYMGIMDIATIFNALENNAIENIAIVSMMGQSDTTIDTTLDGCETAVKKGLLKMPFVGFVHSFPNPFNKKVTVAFYNPSNKASIQIFNAKGAIITRQDNIRGNFFTWNPAGLTQGRYLVKVTTGNRSVTRKMLYMK